MLWKIVIISLIDYLAIYACPNECVCEGQTIDCSSRQLTSLPNDLPTEILSQGTEITLLLTEKATTFTSLNFANNQLKELPGSLLSDKLPHLNILDLSNNKIQEISHIQSIILSKELLDLKLSTNPIRNLGYNADTILYSQSISHLDVSSCAINSITSSLSFMYMLNLTHLNLSKNPLIVIDNLFSSTLVHLDLSHGLLGDKGIREESFTNLPKLEFLNLSVNAQLTKFPQSTQLSSSLLHLDASYCAFEKLDLRSFPNLCSAIMKGNIIKVLYNNMLSENVQLQSLDISENFVHIIEPNAFLGSSSLKKLDLTLNHLTNVDWNVFSQCSRLTVLNISRNLFTSLDEIPIPSLTALDASKCEIFRLSPRFLTKAPNLRYLNLSNNGIEILPKRMSSKKLVNLDLSYCRISDIQYETFAGLSSLNSLNLMGNRMTIPMKGSLLDQLLTITELNLSNNPWHCDCNDPELKKFWKLPSSLYIKKIQYLKSLICHSPREFAGVSLEKNCFENLTTNMHKVSKNGPLLSFLVPFLTLCCFLAIVIVIRQAYTNHALEVQERELSNQRSISPQRRTPSPRVPAHFFDEDLERGIQMSVNESTQRSIRELSKLPSYEEALLLPKPTSREHLQKIVKDYEERDRFARASSESGHPSTLESTTQGNDDSAVHPSTSEE